MEQVRYIVGANCGGCGACVRFCPVGAIQRKNGRAFILPEQCTRCGKCKGHCYFNAIRAVRA